MRRLALVLILAIAPTVAFAASLGVPLDQSVRISLPAPAHDVIVGNPAIADVSVSDQRHLVVTGKSGGVTNLIVTNLAGRTIFDRQIVVSASSGDHVSLINGGDVVTYACAPGCAMVGSVQQAPGGSSQAAAPATPIYPQSAPAPAVTASPTTP